jgi:hypothetical protein
MIAYYQGEQSFHLATKNASYLFAIYKNAYPIHLYWGKRVYGQEMLWSLEASYRRYDRLLAPMPDDSDAPPGEDGPMMPPPPPQSDGPIGFWSDLVSAVRKELRPPGSGFFTNSPQAPVRGVLRGNRLELHCSNKFIAESIDKPEILETVSRKAGAMLGQPVRVFIVDLTAKPAGNPRMEQLMKFGMEHSDIVKIKNN